MPSTDDTLAAGRDALVLRSPDALVSALPYLVGFTPHASIVLMWVTRGRLLLTQRMDLPAGDPSEEFLDVMWAHEAAQQAEEVIVCVVTDGPRPAALVPAVIARAEVRGVCVRDVLVVDGLRWRSLLCEDPACCPEAGREVDPSVLARLSAEFAVLGVAPRECRADLEGEVARDEVRATRLARCLDEARHREKSADRELWRDEAADQVGELLRGCHARGPLTDEEVASIMVALTDVRVRDTVLWESARLDAESMRSAHALLQEVTRCAPDDVLAPVATCGAVLAWLIGDGARALISIERALAADGSYSLACLVMTALRAGLPPTSWREAMTELSREDCRMPRHAA